MYQGNSSIGIQLSQNVDLTLEELKRYPMQKRIMEHTIISSRVNDDIKNK